MYKVCFVDDECINHQLLENLVDWEGLGYQVVGTATDGIEALQLYEQKKPDLMFIDIKMPLMDGLECARCIREEDSKVQIILVSAFGDFTYAQKAIHYGVQDFLLKPVSRIVLNQLVEKMKKILDELNTVTDMTEEYSHNANSILFIQILKEIESNNINSVIQSQKYDAFFEQVSDIARLQIFSWNGRRISLEKTEDFQKELIKVIKQKNYKILSAFQEEAGVIMLAYEGENDKKDELWNKMMELATENGYCVDIFGMKKTANRQELSNIFQLLILSENFGFYTAKSNIFWKRIESAFVEKSLVNNCSDVIEEALRENNVKLLLTYMEELLQSAKEQNINPSILKNAVLDILVQLKIKLKVYFSQDAFYILRSIKVDEFRRIQKVSLLKEYLSNVLERAFEDLARQLTANSREQVMVSRANSYAKTYFSSIDFSVQKVAEYLGMSKNYFVTVYKETVRIGFWDYVTTLRMNKAKEYLLTTEDTAGTISRNVGYESEYHFSRKFKEIVGESPNQFRKNHGKINI